MASNPEVREQVEALSKMMGEAMSPELRGELLAAAVKTAPGPSKITHSHLHRVSNAQKQVDKAKAAVKALDEQWNVFTEKIKGIWATESAAYLAKRTEAVQQLKKHKEKLSDAQEQLKSAAQNQTVLIDDPPGMEQQEEIPFEMEPPDDSNMETISEEETAPAPLNLKSPSLTPFSQQSVSPKRKEMEGDQEKEPKESLKREKKDQKQK